jgi:hypothetical protein
MIKEFALEPTLLSTWKDFRYYYDSVGMSKGRLISRYPKNWKRLVYETLGDCGDVERKRIEERLIHIDRKLLPRDNSWDAGKTWVANAQEEHQIRPFDGIICGEKLCGHDAIICNENLDECDGLWKAETQIDVERVASLMALRVRVLLQNCRELIFVDPHFSPVERRYLKTLGAFLDIAAQARNPPGRIEYYVGDKWANSEFESVCAQRLPQCVPTGLVIVVVSLSEKPCGEKLHDRFILTDRGGVQFSVGLDEGQRGQTTKIAPLSEESWESTRERYLSDCPAFERASAGIKIIGRR